MTGYCLLTQTQRSHQLSDVYQIKNTSSPAFYGFIFPSLYSAGTNETDRSPTWRNGREKWIESDPDEILNGISFAEVSMKTVLMATSGFQNKHTCNVKKFLVQSITAPETLFLRCAHSQHNALLYRFEHQRQIECWLRLKPLLGWLVRELIVSG